MEDDWNTLTHRVDSRQNWLHSILSYLAREREESDANFPDQNVQRHGVTSLETTRLLANGPSWGGGGAEGEVWILRSWERRIHTPWERRIHTSP